MITKELFKEKLLGVHCTIGFVNPLENDFHPILAVKSFHRLMSSNPKWQMKIIGFGPLYVDIQSYVKENDLGRKVMLYGPLSHNEIYDVFKRVDIVVVPSKYNDDRDVTKAISALGTPIVIHEGHHLYGGNNINQALISHDGSKNNLVEKLELAVNSIVSFDSGNIRSHRLNGVLK